MSFTHWLGSLLLGLIVSLTSALSMHHEVPPPTYPTLSTSPLLSLDTSHSEGPIHLESSSTPLGTPDENVSKNTPLTSTTTSRAIGKTRTNTPKSTKTTSKNSTSTKPRFISIYLNYPEKAEISPEKIINFNFNKIFQISLTKDTEARSTPIVIPILSSQTTTTGTPTPQNTPTVAIQQENKSTSQPKDAIVNIYCTIRQGQTIKAITGSGVIIDSRGIILTVAHVGEYPLVQDSLSGLTCVGRTGSPINKTYGIRALYVSNTWIQQNKQNMTSASFSESGQNDVALLQLIDTKNPSNKTYSYLPLSTQISPSIGNNISIASYPANILGTNGINFLLSVQLEPLKISNIFSFSSDETDLIETTDSLQAQPGSSGGAVLDSTGNVIGVVAITVAGDSPFAKHARAITISEINKTIQGDTGMTLSSILSSDLTGITQQFNSNKASLVSMLLGV